MPIPDELIAQIQEQDTGELADALQEDAHGHYQKIYQRGFSTAHNEAKEKRETLEAKVSTLEGEISEKEDAIEALEASDGDTDERVKQLKAEKADLEDSNQSLKAERDAAREEASEAAKGYHADGLQNQVVSKLIEKGADPEYAREVLAPKIGRRINVKTEEQEDGSVTYDARFMDDDGVTPVQAENGSLADVAAGNVYADVDDKWKTSGADGGGGSQSKGGSPSNGGYDPQAAGKAAAEAQKGSENEELALS